MSNNLKGAVALLVIGLAAVAAIRIGKPLWKERQQRQTSDARATKGTISIASDNWIGYFPLCSPEMKKRMRTSTGWILECQDDKADYAARMKRLKNSEIDIAVATVDSYILNATSYGFPGVMTLVIDESKGGDAIVARKDRVPNIDAVKGRKDLKVAFTPNSPSHHLLKAVSTHFDVPELLPQGANRIETDGSPEALKKLLGGTTDVAVLWEPDVSRALANDNIIKLLSTKDTYHLIVDILLISRDYSQGNPDVVMALFENYFRTLKLYRDNPDRLIEDVMAATSLPRETVITMLDGVAWVNLADNAEKWFGVSAPGVSAEHGLAQTIDSTVEVLRANSDFSSNPVPNNDPYRLTESKYINDLYVRGITGFTSQPVGSVPVVGTAFSHLDDNGWSALRVVGTLKIKPITFQSGSEELNLEGKEDLDQVAHIIRQYPNFRFIVKGHSGVSGDPEANKLLSRERAESVIRYLDVTHAIDMNRMHAVGMGSRELLARQIGESDRAYNYRLPRVEIMFVSEVF